MTGNEGPLLDLRERRIFFLAELRREGAPGVKVQPGGGFLGLGISPLKRNLSSSSARLRRWTDPSWAVVWGSWRSKKTSSKVPISTSASIVVNKRTRRNSLGRSYRALHDVRLVELLEALDVVSAQSHIKCFDRLFDLLDPRCAQYWSRDPGLAEMPGEGDLCRADPLLTRNLFHPLEHIEVVVVEVKALEVLVRPVAGTPPSLSFLLLPREKASRQRAVGDEGDPKLSAGGDHLPLLLSLDQVVPDRHRDDRFVTFHLRGPYRIDDLPCERG